MSLSFPEPCICLVVSNMFGEPVESINKEVEDAVGELTNTISGDARRELTEKGIMLQGDILAVISGKDHTVRHMTLGPVIAIPCSTQAGSFVVEVGFRD